MKRPAGLAGTRQPRRRIAGVVALLATLWLAQFVGLWHAHEHARPADGQAPHVALLAKEPGAAGGTGTAGHGAHGNHQSHDGHAAHAAHGESAHDHWQHDAGSIECRLLDGLVALALPSAGLVAATAPPAPPRVAGALPRPTVAEAPGDYLARAPPRG